MSNTVTVNGTNAFGYYTGEQVGKIDLSFSKETAKSRAVQINISKILGYIPVISYFKTALEFSNPFKKEDVDKFPQAKQTRSYRVFFVLRFTAELLNVGILFLIPDIIFTIGRNYHHSKAADLTSKKIEHLAR